MRITLKEICITAFWLSKTPRRVCLLTFAIKGGQPQKWGTKTRDFWCCHGTMVQAQASYPEWIYFEDTENDELVVSQYIPSSLEYQRGKTGSF